MKRQALARRIAELLFNEPATRRGAGAAPTRRAARILAGCFVARRSKTTAGILTPRAAHPGKIRAALLYEPRTWCTSSGFGPEARLTSFARLEAPDRLRL